MSEAERIADLERRLEELRRVNRGLGRELTAANAGRTPRSPAVGARVLTRLTHQRDTAEAELETTRAELERLRGEREYLLAENQVLRAELNRLRPGALGLARRLRGRLLRR